MCSSDLPILLTPYVDKTTIDTDKLSDFIHTAYRNAQLTPDDIDTGAIIVTGEAAKKKNAEAISASRSRWLCHGASGCGRSSNAVTSTMVRVFGNDTARRAAARSRIGLTDSTPSRTRNRNQPRKVEMVRAIEADESDCSFSDERNSASCRGASASPIEARR